MNSQVTLQRRASHRFRDIRLRHGVPLGVRHGKKRRHYPWVEAASGLEERLAAVPYSETTLVPDETHAQNGTETTECETRRTDLRRNQMARGTERAESRGVSRDYCTRDWLHSPSVLLCTSLEQATKVSRRQHCDSLAHRSSSLASRVVYYEYCSAYSRSRVADGGPTTRRAEDCPVTGRARRCRWRAAVGDRGRAPLSVLPRGGSTHPRAMCRVYRAGKKMSVCGGIVPLPRLYSRAHRPELGLPEPHRSLFNRRGAPPPWSSPPPADPHPATSHSRAPTANLYLAPLSCAPNKAINILAISLFYTDDTIRRSRDSYVKFLLVCFARFKNIPAKCLIT